MDFVVFNRVARLKGRDTPVAGIPSLKTADYRSSHPVFSPVASFVRDSDTHPYASVAGSEVRLVWV